ncbi:UNVERIFIED_CONTAM: hypothetical protein GTU68_031427 [Idotea baltica]|nr:hypothetical protein [Idotea baltica]
MRKALASSLMTKLEMMSLYTFQEQCLAQ